MKSVQAGFWQQAMEEEMSALWQNGVLEQVPATYVPAGQTALPTRWVYTVKRTPTGEIDRHKARLVVQGCRQIEGVDFGETFAPTSHRTSLRMLLATIAQENMELRQLDVKTAFLQSELQEEVYVQPPPGLEQGEGQRVVYRLRRALYGLKQAPRAWHQKLKTVLTEMCPAR
jgi:histone deacetylase 1/2